MATPRLLITDGTTTVDLLASSGFYLRDWHPGRPEPKSVKRAPVLGGGGQMVWRNWGNVVDTLEIGARHNSEDDLIAECQDADRLLQKALDYWTTSWATEPVWIEARSPTETNTRYAPIKDYQIAGETNPYGQPFFGIYVQQGFDEMTLVLEHEPWMDHPPGEAGGLSISATDSNNYGRVATTLSEVYVSNKHNTSQLTTIFSYDASVPAWSGNLFGAALPYFLWPSNPPGAGDYLYVGVAAAAARPWPFDNIVWDIDTNTGFVYAGADTCHWEYWNGAWVNLVYHDNTEFDPVTAPNLIFDNRLVGVRSVHWQIPADWVQTAVNGVNGWWVRAVWTGVAGSAGRPRQQTPRQPYTSNLAKIDIAAGVVGGDIPALTRWPIRCKSDYLTTADGTASLRGSISQVVMGLRSRDRGYVNNRWFSAYLPLGVVNPAGYYIISGSGGVTQPAEVRSSYGSISLCTFAGIGTEWVTLTSSAIEFATAYCAGKFHAFLRYRRPDGLDDELYATLSYGTSTNALTTTLTTTGRQNLRRSFLLWPWMVVDFGTITINPAALGKERGLGFAVVSPQFRVDVTNTVAAPRTCQLMDIVLIPADEWYLSTLISRDYTDWHMGRSTELDLDSCDAPKDRRAAMIRYIGPSQTYNDIASSVTRFCSNENLVHASAPSGTSPAQEMWFFFINTQSLATRPCADVHLACELRAEMMQRYLMLRGAR